MPIANSSFPDNPKQNLGFFLVEFSGPGGTMQRWMGMIVFLAMGLAIAGCGNGNGGVRSGNINGTWSALLTNSGYSFSTTFTQGSGETLNVTNFTFTSPGPCFASDQTSETGTFGFMGS